MLNYYRLCTVVTGALLFFTGTCDKPNPVDGDDGDKKPIFGSFQITLVGPEGGSTGYSQILGRINDGPTPSPLIWEVKASSGACKLLTPRVPFCSEPCGGMAACVEDDSCQPYPKILNVGTVTVKGIKTKDGASSFTMDQVGGNYQPVGIILAYPPCAEGETVTVTAPGGTSGQEISLSGKGISQLVVHNDSIVLEDGKSITVRWDPPAIAGNTKIHIMMDISHHGGTKGKIEVECDDNGSVTIPGALIDQLKALGYFGFPKMEITRRAVTKDEATNVELVFESKVTKYLFIPGLISCNGDDECPDGMTCEFFRCH